jgi:hypothetical protein
MATTLVYTVSPYVPFTKILSANVNQDKTDIANRLNWVPGTTGTSLTSGLGPANFQSNTAPAETVATGTIGGVTYTAVAGQGVNGNSITIAYTSGGTAGAEVVTAVGLAISVQIASGTSTVTQVRTAVNASAAASALVSATGTSASTVSTTSATNLSGGVTGSGITRGTILALDTANYVVINGPTGAMTSEGQLATSRGGTGINVTPANQNPGDVVQINSTQTGFSVGPPTAVPTSLRVFQFKTFI